VSKVKKNAKPSLQQQENVNAYFQSQSTFWKEIYVSNSVYAEIHRNRLATVLTWIDSLMLTADSKVLEIGCGAGLLAVALAKHGFRVHAIDPVEDMVKQARRHVVESGTSKLLSVDLGNVYSLPFEGGSFDLVVAVGVIPWLERPDLAIQEMARVTRSGGYLLLTADNRARLNNVLDPWLNPVLAPLKKRLKDTLDRLGLRRKSLEDIGATSHSRRFIDLLLMRAELIKTRSTTLGFGPFSLLRRTLIPESFGTKLHYQLQRLADRNVLVLRSSGAHYIVLARKSTSLPCALSLSDAKTISNATKRLSQ
jgi:ubiquinone/menaquinone biosynthesis C-methylase UbiE